MDEQQAREIAIAFYQELCGSLDGKVVTGPTIESVHELQGPKDEYVVRIGPADEPDPRERFIASTGICVDPDTGHADILR